MLAEVRDQIDHALIEWAFVEVDSVHPLAEHLRATPETDNVGNRRRLTTNDFNVQRCRDGRSVPLRGR